LNPPRTTGAFLFEKVRSVVNLNRGFDRHAVTKAPETRIIPRVPSMPDIESDSDQQGKLSASLQEIISAMRYDEASSKDRSSLSEGPSSTVIVFAGTQGPEKIAAANVLAEAAASKVLRVELNGLISKYIGETEKNIAHFFANAADSGVTLFFDEADSLFGKRSEVQDAHDRYANIEISYVLQRLEEHRGLAIFALSDTKNLDEAFVRRLRFIINFPYPDATK
jgi:SpoVK/Ycf46/Vps4 family AAA+-type ATPase